MNRNTGWLFGMLTSIVMSSPALAQGVPGLPGLSPTGAAQTNPFSNTNQISYGNPFGMMPKFTPDFWKSVTGNRLRQGTILTGILEDNLSSKSSKPGDVFSIRLQDGFVDGGNVLIPPQSKIIGSVTAVRPAYNLRHGEPGSVDISLQTLVFPDGRHMPFFGNMEHNPAQDPHYKPGKQPIDFSGTAKRSANTLLTLVTGRVGMPIRLSQHGLEFKLQNGEVVPIKCSRSMDVAHMAPGPAMTATSPGLPPNMMQSDPMSLYQQGTAGPPVQGIAAPAALSLTDVPPTAPTPGAPPIAPSRANFAPGATPYTSPANMPDPF